MDKFGIFNLINALSGVLKNNPVEGAGVKENLSEEKPAELSAAARAAATPLQSSMLTTMRSHEEFVKRVKSAKKGAR